MTTKQKLFIKEFQATGNATESAHKVYKVKNRHVAKSIGSENLSKPVIKQALESNVHLFESTIVKVVNDWGNSDNTRQREIALNNAQWGHDKVLGKAKQSIETKNLSVEVKLDLSGVRLGTHYINAPTDKEDTNNREAKKLEA
jgi:phage terminase small subunit